MNRSRESSPRPRPGVGRCGTGRRKTAQAVPNRLKGEGRLPLSSPAASRRLKDGGKRRKASRTFVLRLSIREHGETLEKQKWMERSDHTSERCYSGDCDSRGIRFFFYFRDRGCKSSHNFPSSYVTETFRWRRDAVFLCFYHKLEAIL